MIKRREKTQSTDLLVCFPSRAHHLTLMPKPICSPSRPSEPNKRHNYNHNHNHNPHLKRINTRVSGASTGGPNSPLMWDKNNQIKQELAEPTSPKVTCAGQIKVRPRSSTACKSWQSVMEEIERIHNRGKDSNKNKKPNWVEAFGFKKDVTNFLTCLRNIKLDFRCFGGFPQADIVSTSDDEDEEEEEFEDDEFEICEENHPGNNIVTDHISSNNNNDDHNNNNAVFSKWFMVLQENNDNDQGKDVTLVQEDGIIKENDDDAPAVPPPNALLLMRCRSAPAKSWLEEKEIESKEEKLLVEEVKVEEEEEEEEEEEKRDKKKRESLAILMKYDTDFYKLSSEIAHETWVGDGLKDPLSRSRSWRR